jgi:hypothetical protein
MYGSLTSTMEEMTVIGRVQRMYAPAVSASQAAAAAAAASSSSAFGYAYEADWDDAGLGDQTQVAGVGYVSVVGRSSAGQEAAAVVSAAVSGGFQGFSHVASFASLRTVSEGTNDHEDSTSEHSPSSSNPESPHGRNGSGTGTSSDRDAERSDRARGPDSTRAHSNRSARGGAAGIALSSRSPTHHRPSGDGGSTIASSRGGGLPTGRRASMDDAVAAMAASSSSSSVPMMPDKPPIPGSASLVDLRSRSDSQPSSSAAAAAAAAALALLGAGAPMPAGLLKRASGEPSTAAGAPVPGLALPPAEPPPAASEPAPPEHASPPGRITFEGVRCLAVHTGIVPSLLDAADLLTLFFEVGTLSPPATPSSSSERNTPAPAPPAGTAPASLVPAVLSASLTYDQFIVLLLRLANRYYHRLYSLVAQPRQQQVLISAAPVPAPRVAAIQQRLCVLLLWLGRPAASAPVAAVLAAAGHDHVLPTPPLFVVPA